MQLIRAWTKGNHFAIHDLIAATLGLRADDRFWNEHNFVFRRSDGLFYHAKGATPAYADFSSDTNGLTLIPLNMAEPILITRGLDAAAGLGFSPHGAGRNFSRSAYVKQNAGKSEADLIAEQAPESTCAISVASPTFPSCRRVQERGVDAPPDRQIRLGGSRRPDRSDRQHHGGRLAARRPLAEEASSAPIVRRNLTTCETP